MVNARRWTMLRALCVAASMLVVTACEDKKVGNRSPGASLAYSDRVGAKPGPNQADPSGAKHNTENFQHFVENDYVLVAKEAQSTFSASVDTAAYSILRRMINEGRTPPKDAVRIADLLNYFEYDYPQPQGNDPLAAKLELGPCPWNTQHHLLRIAVAAKKISPSELPPRNFVFLVDTSGSMSGPDRLPLVCRSMEVLSKTLGHRDRVSIVTYAGDASLRLPPTPGTDRQAISRAIQSLRTGGSTNGGGGIVMAYDQARRSFIEGGMNRVILATDGDFNVGVSSEGDLIRLIEKQRESGVFLTVLGYGMGNLQDAKLEQLSRHGNGNYAYIDSVEEADKVFGEMGGGLVTVAKDVKLQVDFNGRRVQAYRLIGYENRLLKNEDFENDAKDAGEVNSGHTVTALYEIVPAGVDLPQAQARGSRYQMTTVAESDAAKSGEWLTFRMRFKEPDGDQSREISQALPANSLQARPSQDFGFAAAVASFGLILRDSPHKGTADYALVRRLTQQNIGPDEKGYRRDFADLVEATQRLNRQDR